jgi:hypothetical protein
LPIVFPLVGAEGRRTAGAGGVDVDQWTTAIARAATAAATPAISAALVVRRRAATSG